MKNIVLKKHQNKLYKTMSIIVKSVDNDVNQQYVGNTCL
jgi:hypothetical protein